MLSSIYSHFTMSHLDILTVLAMETEIPHLGFVGTKWLTFIERYITFLSRSETYNNGHRHVWYGHQLQVSTTFKKKTRQIYIYIFL